MEKNKAPTGHISIGTFLFVLSIFLVLILLIFYNSILEKNNANERITKLELQLEEKITEYEKILEEKDEELYLLEEAFAELNTTSKDSKEDSKDSNTNSKENFKENSNTVETPTDSFIRGRYSYNYTDVLDSEDPFYGELELSMGFLFNSDGTIYAFLPGHETGGLNGTYEVSDKTITCKFTTYENECSGTYGVKLEQEGELTLNRLSKNELAISSWDKKPVLNGEDLSYGINNIFTLNWVE